MLTIRLTRLIVLGACVGRLAARPPMITPAMRVESTCSTEHGFWRHTTRGATPLHHIHVAFFDNRQNPDTESMLRAAKLIQTSAHPVRFHAMLSVTRDLPGIQVHRIQLPPFAQCLHKYLASSAHGPGPQYMYKLFTPWILPRHVPRVILLDTDIAVLGSIQELWNLFDHFNGALIGLANEQNALYAPLTGKNGGVQLYDLDGIRASDHYLHVMATFNVNGYRLGYLGDQTYYTILNHLHPKLVYQVSCAWNRQLNTHFGIGDERFSRCDEGCSLLHANHAPVKCVVQQLQARGNISCAAWRDFVERPECLTMEVGPRRSFQGALRRFFSSCCRHGDSAPR